MNKIVLLAVLALTGCAETANEGAYLIGSGGHAAGGGGDVTSSPAYRAPRDVAPREVAVRHAQPRHEADFVVCAQCRH
jgi:hypothetical protein